MDTLLQHNLQKFGAVTVMDVLLYDTETNKPILFLDTLKITSIGQEGQQKEIRGGQGAPLLISYDYARSVTIEIQDALASLGSLSVLWGANLKDSGNINYTSIFDAVPADDAGTSTITVPSGVVLAEKAAESVKVLDYFNGKEYTVATAADGKITLDEVPPANTTLKVFVPAVAVANADAGISSLAIQSISMPPTVRLVGKTEFIHQATGKPIPVEIEVPLLKINISGGLALEAEGDASVFDFNGQALAHPVSKNFFEIKYLK